MVRHQWIQVCAIPNDILSPEFVKFPAAVVNEMRRLKMYRRRSRATPVLTFCCTECAQVASARGLAGGNRA